MIYKQCKGVVAMKKLLPIIMIFMLCGCSADQENISVTHPYELSTNNKILSYYGKSSEFTDENFDIITSVLKSIQSNINNVYVDKGDNIRSIVITDKDVSTYKGISVGDNISAIEKAFSYETNVGENYTVLFDSDKEIDPKSSSKKDDFIWLNFTTNDKTIEKISIYDVKFGREMR